MVHFQKLCLRWNNHSNNFIGNLGTLLTSEEYSDVTLCCQGEVWHLHQLILSAASVHFAQLLRRIPAGQTPILILDGPSARDVGALIHFIYHGEVNVDEDRLSSLMQTASSLHIKGLSEAEGLTQVFHCAGEESFKEKLQEERSLKIENYTTQVEEKGVSISKIYEEDPLDISTPLNLSCNKKSKDIKIENTSHLFLQNKDNFFEENKPSPIFLQNANYIEEEKTSPIFLRNVSNSGEQNKTSAFLENGNNYVEGNKTFPTFLRNENICLAKKESFDAHLPPSKRLRKTTPTNSAIISNQFQNYSCNLSPKQNAIILVPKQFDNQKILPQETEKNCIQNIRKECVSSTEQKSVSYTYKATENQISAGFYSTPVQVSLPVINVALSNQIYQQQNVGQNFLPVSSNNNNFPKEMVVLASNVSKSKNSIIRNNQNICNVKTNEPQIHVDKGLGTKPVKFSQNKPSIQCPVTDNAEPFTANKKFGIKEEVILPNKEDKSDPENDAQYEIKFSHKKFSACQSSHSSKKNLYVRKISDDQQSCVNAIKTSDMNLSALKHTSEETIVPRTDSQQTSLENEELREVVAPPITFSTNLVFAAAPPLSHENAFSSVQNINADSSPQIENSTIKSVESMEHSENLNGTTHGISVGTSSDSCTNPQRGTVNMRTFKEEWRRQLLVDYDAKSNMSICMLCFTTFKSYDGPRKNTYVKHAKRFHPALQSYSEDEREVIISMYEKYHKYDLDMQKEINKSFRISGTSANGWRMKLNGLELKGRIGSTNTKYASPEKNDLNQPELDPDEQAPIHPTVVYVPNNNNNIIENSNNKTNSVAIMSPPMTS